MSTSEKTTRSSLKDRIKPHVKTAVVCLTVGAAVGIIVYRRNLVPVFVPKNGLWLSEGMTNQLKEHGQAMIQISETGQLVDLIDWGHPKTAHLSK